VYFRKYGRRLPVEEEGEGRRKRTEPRQPPQGEKVYSALLAKIIASKTFKPKSSEGGRRGPEGVNEKIESLMDTALEEEDRLLKENPELWWEKKKSRSLLFSEKDVNDLEGEMDNVDYRFITAMKKVMNGVAGREEYIIVVCALT
jgi:hypothetical protein